VIAQHISRGIDQPDWAVKALLRLGALNSDVRRLIRVLQSEASPAFKTAITTAYTTGQLSAAKDLGVAFKTKNKNIPAIRNLMLDAKRVQQVTGLKIASSAPMIYQQTITNASQRMLGGAQTRKAAAAEALADFADDGVTGFTDKAGRNWNLVSYAEMATRTMAGRAVVSGHIDELLDIGHDLVQVSSADEDCPLCSPWDDAILSSDGSTAPGDYDGYTVAGSMDDATEAGLFHPNCRHDVNVFIPDVTSTGSAGGARREVGVNRNGDEADDEAPSEENSSPAYVVRQQQRTLERNVRAAKDRVAVATQIAGKDDAVVIKEMAKLKRRQAALRDFNKANDRFQGGGRTSTRVR
jgi:hypothetical protein